MYYTVSGAGVELGAAAQWGQPISRGIAHGHGRRVRWAWRRQAWQRAGRSWRRLERQMGRAEAVAGARGRGGQAKGVGVSREAARWRR